MKSLLILSKLLSSIIFLESCEKWENIVSISHSEQWVCWIDLQSCNSRRYRRPLSITPSLSLPFIPPGIYLYVRVVSDNQLAATSASIDAAWSYSIEIPLKPTVINSYPLITFTSAQLNCIESASKHAVSRSTSCVCACVCVFLCQMVVWEHKCG